MDEFWGITIVMFIILIAFVAFVVRLALYYGKYHDIRYKRVRLTEAYPDLKTGDVLLFIAHTHGFTNSLVTQDLFSHSGMVVEIGGELYVSEATGDHPRCSHINPLVARLRDYPGTLFLMRLENSPTADQEDVLRTRARERIPYPGPGEMLQAICRLPVHRRARHCMQHVAWLLDEAGLTPDYLEGRTLLGTGFFGSSKAVTTLPGKPLAEGTNKYTDIVELVYDLDA